MHAFVPLLLVAGYMRAIMEGGQESGVANLCLLNVDADDATDIASSDSKVLGEGLNVGEKGLR